MSFTRVPGLIEVLLDVEIIVSQPGWDLLKHAFVSVWGFLTYKHVLANKPSDYCLGSLQFRAQPIITSYHQWLNTMHSNSWMSLITYIVDISSHTQNKKVKSLDVNESTISLSDATIARDSAASQVRTYRECQDVTKSGQAWNEE